MRVDHLYDQDKPVISMEFFPFRDDKTRDNFHTTLDALAPLNPDYCSVTFGAGGSTRDGSYQTVKAVCQDKNLPCVAYIAGYGLGPDEISQVLDAYKKMGIETIFVLRGDEPKDPDFTPHPKAFAHASDLLAFISENYDFTLGCAGYPEGHIQAPNLDTDIEYLKLKQECGAQYVVVQYFYDNADFFDYVKRCRGAGITIPIIPGIMPVYSVKMTRNLSRICGTSLPQDLKEKLNALEGKPVDQVLDMGIDYAFNQCRDLIQNGVKNLHFYTMNRSRSTREIITRLRRDQLI